MSTGVPGRSPSDRVCSRTIAGTRVDAVPDTTAEQPIHSLADLTVRMRDFTEERAWERFHDPKSLALALVGEVGELAELLQWVPADRAVEHFSDPARRTRIGEELADVLLYLVRLSDVLGVDLTAAALAKLATARERFPASDVQGVAPTKD